MIKKALLLGAYGQTNLGDDLLLYNYLKFLTELGFEKIYINASEARYIPRVIQEEFPEMEVFETYHTSPLKLFGLIAKVDAVFYGGGTVYKEMYATTGRAPYTVIAGVAVFNSVARVMGKKVYGLHIGIGSIKTALGRFFSRIALRVSTKTTFRDEKSYRYARDVLKIPERLIEQSTDGLFINPGWREQWETYHLPRKKPGQQVVGVNILSDIPDWVDRKKYIAIMQRFIAQLLKEGNYVVIIPFQTGFNPANDLHFIKQEIIPHVQEFNNLTVLEDVGIDTVTSVLKQLDVLVGMRLHSLFLATVAETPFLALAYDTKCWRFVEEANYPHALKLEDLTSEKLYESYTQLVQAKASAQQSLKEISETNYKGAEAWTQTFIP